MLFSASPEIKLLINPEIVIRSFESNDIFILPVPIQSSSEITYTHNTIFKRTYETDPSSNIYVKKIAGVEIVTYRTAKEDENDTVHCQWCSTIHPIAETIGIPIAFKLVCVHGNNILVKLETGYNCNDRCMMRTMKTFAPRHIRNNAKILFDIIYEKIPEPAPDRETHKNFNGMLTNEQFLEETSDIKYRETHTTLRLGKVFTKVR